jgi:hypothetical protein
LRHESYGKEASGAVLLDRLDWLRSELAKVVPPATDEELARWIGGLMRGPR